MSDKYVLEGREVRVEPDLMRWAEWFEGGMDRRRIGKDTVGAITVSTVFLGLDHAYGDQAPQLFETLCFGGMLDQDMERYATYDEAEAGHARWMQKATEVQVSPEGI